MLYWIFDLDNTLYQINNKYFNYNKLSYDDSLKKNLSVLPGNKIMFTNGTYNHAEKCIDILKLNRLFNNIISRDMISCLKPEFVAYQKMSLICDIDSCDKCVFFEDSIRNLRESKKIGWITVLISKEQVDESFIDFCFPSINHALKYFLNKINDKSKN
tara:strand:+ start:294 stop:767 length:474 start_codon:yes stop_codon:yes gene_type:complete